MRYAKEKDIKPNLDPCCTKKNWTAKLHYIIFVFFVKTKISKTQTPPWQFGYFFSSKDFSHPTKRRKVQPGTSGFLAFHLPQLWLCGSFKERQGVNKKPPVLCSYPVPRVSWRSFSKRSGLDVDKSKGPLWALSTSVAPSVGVVMRFAMLSGDSSRLISQLF